MEDHVAIILLLKYAMHADNEVPPMDGLYDPAGQAMQVALLVNGLSVPAWQTMHDAAVLPVELLKVPGVHSMQPKPFKLMTEPATQKGQRELLTSAEKRSW